MPVFIEEQGSFIRTVYYQAGLGHGDKSLINEPVFAELGKKYGKSLVQFAGWRPTFEKA